MPSEQSDTGGCQCAVPDYRVDKGWVDDWYVQIVVCEDCTGRIKTHVDHAAHVNEEADERRSMVDDMGANADA